MKELNPRKLTMEDAILVAHGVAGVRRSDMMNANAPRDPEREAFDKWWDRKSSEPLNYRDIKHYAWSAWIESSHRTMTIISEKVDSLKKGKV